MLNFANKADRISRKPGQLKAETDKLELCLQEYQEYPKPKGCLHGLFQLDSGLMLNGILTPSSADFVKQHFNR